MARNDNAMHAQQTYLRFQVSQRIEHALLILSFGTLGLTGLIQRYAGNQAAETLIVLLGGIELVRIIHRVAAILLAGQSIYHVLALIHKVFVMRVEMTMLPGLKDIIDAIDVVRHNLGLTQDHPKLPRYNFTEKAEYWAMIWGTIVMGLTGFMLWNPIITTRLLPGEIIPAAKAAHSAEALLAVLAIFVWHFYNVHLKSLNKAIFTGKMTRRQMHEEHGAELEQIETGRLRPRPNLEALRRRERIFLPAALVLTILGIAFFAWFATGEKTAIATLPSPVTQVPAFAPLPTTPVPTPVGGINNAKIGAAIKHAVAGMEKCDTCHGPKGIQPAPADHVDRPVESCLVCHQPAPGAGAAPTAGQTGLGGAKAIPHGITEATYKDCVTCHGQGKLKPGPVSHAAFTNESCTICHKPAPPTATPVAGATPKPAAGGPKAIPANHDLANATYKDCTVCHGQGKLKPAPANHASYTAETCATCHQPAATGAPTAGATPGAAGQPAAAAKPVNHSVTSDMFKNCATCHGKDGMKPSPDNHASFTNEVCTTCHKPTVQ